MTWDASALGYQCSCTFDLRRSVTPGFGVCDALGLRKGEKLAKFIWAHSMYCTYYDQADINLSS